jgi:hypothetical protein
MPRTAHSGPRWCSRRAQGSAERCAMPVAICGACRIMDLGGRTLHRCPCADRPEARGMRRSLALSFPLRDARALLRSARPPIGVPDVVAGIPPGDRALEVRRAAPLPPLPFRPVASPHPLVGTLAQVGTRPDPRGPADRAPHGPPTAAARRPHAVRRLRLPVLRRLGPSGLTTARS